MGLSGQSDRGRRDLTVDAMRAAATRLTRKYPAEVSAGRYRVRHLEVDGFVIWTGPVFTEHGTQWHGPHFEVPVRQRLRIGRYHGEWRTLRSVPAAAAEAGRLASSGSR
jgi:hypothetical protein